MNTPWGKTDYRKQIERGVNWVGTPSHGGLVVTEQVARQRLTPEAIAQGDITCQCGTVYNWDG